MPALNKPTLAKISLATICSIALTACGGGGSDDSNEPTVPSLDKALCFDNSIYQANAKYQLQFLEGSRGITVSGTVESTNANYENNSNLVKFIEVHNNVVNTVVVRYIKPLASGIVAQYGTEAAQGTIAYTVTKYSPPYEDRRAELAIGTTGTYVGQGTREVVFPWSGNGPQPYTRTDQIKFVGVESITMPAGTFTACRYEVNGTTEWWHRGMVIRQDFANGQSQILQSGELNGTPLKSQ